MSTGGRVLVLVGVAALGVLLLSSACSQRGRVGERAAPEATPGTAAPKPARENPFGVMLPSRLARSPEGMRLAKDLDAGLRLVLTVRNDGPEATPPPRDLAAYRRALEAVLDRYRPALLVVENEENSALFYAGTPEEYAAELEAACQVAHRKGIPCANGGPVSPLVALLVYDHYVESGQRDVAEDFAARAFEAPQRRLLDSPASRAQIAKGKALLSAYGDAGADFVNFHWYIADPRALEEAAAYLKAQTGLPVITNEVGQFTDDPDQTTAVMAKIVDLGLPVAVWFGLDGPKARGLVDPDGRLRPTGEAFRRFNQQMFAGSN